MAKEDLVFVNSPNALKTRTETKTKAKTKPKPKTTGKKK